MCPATLRSRAGTSTGRFARFSGLRFAAAAAAQVVGPELQVAGLYRRIGVRISSISNRAGTSSRNWSAYGAPAARAALEHAVPLRPPDRRLEPGVDLEGRPRIAHLVEPRDQRADRCRVERGVGVGELGHAYARTCSPRTCAVKPPVVARSGSGVGMPASQHTRWYAVLVSASSTDQLSSSRLTANGPWSVSSRRISPSSPRATGSLSELARPSPNASATV
jgi:hypothetical protein